MPDYNNNPDTPRNRGVFNAPHMTPVTPAEDIRTIMLNRVSWSAVFSGLAVGIALQVVLNLFGFGLGAAAVEAGEAYGAATVSMGALVWWAVSGIVAACAGGFTAGRLSGEPRESTAAWHGLTSWAASVVVIAMLAVSGAGTVLGGAMSAAGIAGDPVFGRNDAAPRADTLSVAPGVIPPAAAATVTEQEADMAARAALICAVALVLGAFAAWVGGWNGAVDPTITDKRMRRESLH